MLGQGRRHPCNSRAGQHCHDIMFSVYAQDVVKMAKKLTFSLGLRYELPNYAVEDNGVMGLFNPALPNPGAGGLPGALEFLGKGPGRSGRFNIFGNYHKSFSPRLSLAYQANQKTVFRLGYGLFRLYLNHGDSTTNALVFAPGFGAVPTVSSTNSGISPALIWMWISGVGHYYK